MAKAGQKILLGCGIGCGVIIVALLVFGGGAALLLKDVATGFKQAEKSEEILVDRYGAVDDYEIPAFGIVSADRMEAFLTVREATHEARIGITAALRTLDAEEGKHTGIDGIIDKVKAGVGVGTEIGRLLAARNRTLVDVAMGLGEYSYIYCLAYYALLDHAPTDGPEGSENIHIGRGGRVIHISDDDDEIRPGGYEQLRRDLRWMLKRQIDAIGDDAPEAELTWRAELETELARMSEDRSYVPWQDDMPEPMARALQPYVERLDATYEPLVNPFELIPAED